MAESSPFQPVGGLGSYKGVMLCNRPPEEGSGGGGLLPGGGQAPFKSMVSATASDRLGLPPARRPEDPDDPLSGSGASRGAKGLGPCAALRRHCQWIKELQQQVQDDQRQVEMDAAAQEERKQRLAVTYKKQRDAIQRIKKEKTAAFLEPAEVAAILNPKASKRGGLPGQKPMWAMTEEEKDGAEDEDAALLIQFAQDLDFDKYINDMEFKHHLKVVKDRAKHLQKQQDDFKDALVREFNGSEDEGLDFADMDADAVSTCDSASGAKRPPALPRRGGEDLRPAWDGSTVCSERPVDAELQGLAEEALERNPQLRAVHSKGSVQRMVEKARSATPSVAATDA